MAELYILRVPGTGRAQMTRKEWVQLRFALLRGPAESRSGAIEKQCHGVREGGTPRGQEAQKTREGALTEVPPIGFTFWSCLISMGASRPSFSWPPTATSLRRTIIQVSQSEARVFFGPDTVLGETAVLEFACSPESKPNFSLSTGSWGWFYFGRWIRST